MFSFNIFSGKICTFLLPANHITLIIYSGLTVKDVFVPTSAINKKHGSCYLGESSDFGIHINRIAMKYFQGRNCKITKQIYTIKILAPLHCFSIYSCVAIASYYCINSCKTFDFYTGEKSTFIILYCDGSDTISFNPVWDVKNKYSISLCIVIIIRSPFIASFITIFSSCWKYYAHICKDMKSIWVISE